jgi:hypothetical protein
MKTIDSFYEKMPTKEQFDLFLINCKEADKRQQENWNYRMENYFNCVDDYSWGGLCDKAANEAAMKRDALKHNLKVQLEKGVFNEIIKLSILCDLDGNIVSDKIVNGKFGQCWIIKNETSVSFIGVAKKQSTYNKKGYKVMTLSINVEYYYLTNGKVISRVLGQEIIDSMLEYQTTHKPSYLYFAN